MHQQAVLGQEAGEQHAVPLLVGDLVEEQGDAGRLVAPAQLPRLGAQPAAQAALGLGHGREGRVARHGQGDQTGARGRLSRVARGDDGAFEVGAEVGGEGCHGVLRLLIPA